MSSHLLQTKISGRYENREDLLNTTQTRKTKEPPSEKRSVCIALLHHKNRSLGQKWVRLKEDCSGLVVTF
jgi:hypothetical protein